MKGKLATLLLMLLLAAMTAAQQNNSANLEADEIRAFIGVWKGEIRKQPAVEVRLKDEGGKLTGAAIFYPLREEDSAPPPAEKIELALNDLKVAGRILSFAWKGPDSSVAKAKLKLVSETEAELKPVGDAEIPDEMKVIKMVRAK